MKKCKYCNKKISDQRDFCNKSCEEQAEKYFKNWEKYKLFFSIVIVGSIIASVGQVIMFPKLVFISQVAVMLMGTTLFALPFGNTVDSIGIKKTVIIVRIFSAVLFVAGLISIIFNFKWPL